MRRPTLLLILAMICSSGATGQRPADRQVPAEERAQMIENVAHKIESNYFDAQIGRRIAKRLRQDAKSGKFDRITSALELTDVIGNRLSEFSNKDRHIGLGYSPKPSPVDKQETEVDLQAEAPDVANGGYGIANVSRLEGNLGYLKVNRFHHPALAAKGVSAAMTLLQGTDALIIDLRGSGGGSPYMVSHLISYFVQSEPRHLFTLRPQEIARSEQYWSVAVVPGPKYLKAPNYSAKPVFILVDKATRSAAEGFTQHMQARGLATVIGTKTRGAAHVALWHRVHPNFAVQIPQYVVHDALKPFDWEGTGISPDIDSGSADALELARAEAVKRIAP